MKIAIVAVGRLKRGPLRELFEGYAGRMRWSLDVHEIDPGREPTADQRRDSEASALLKHAETRDVLVALDEKGVDLDSPALARQIEQWQLDSRGSAAFLIGGPDGLAPAVTKQADMVLSFGRATWPHLLVRAMLAEQLYRAETLISGHPYHRGR